MPLPPVTFQVLGAETGCGGRGAGAHLGGLGRRRHTPRVAGALPPSQAAVLKHRAKYPSSLNRGFLSTRGSGGTDGQAFRGPLGVTPGSTLPGWGAVTLASGLRAAPRVPEPLTTQATVPVTAPLLVAPAL